MRPPSAWVRGSKRGLSPATHPPCLTRDAHVHSFHWYSTTNPCQNLNYPWHESLSTDSATSVLGQPLLKKIVTLFMSLQQTLLSLADPRTNGQNRRKEKKEPTPNSLIQEQRTPSTWERPGHNRGSGCRAHTELLAVGRLLRGLLGFRDYLIPSYA